MLFYRVVLVSAVSVHGPFWLFPVLYNAIKLLLLSKLDTTRNLKLELSN